MATPPPPASSRPSTNNDQRPPSAASTPNHNSGAAALLALVGLPDHCKTAYSYLTETLGWGSSWEKCIEAAIELERASGFPVSISISYSCHSTLKAIQKKVQTLPLDHRPSALEWWFGRGRKHKLPPLDLDDFVTQWKAWYQAMQPTAWGGSQLLRPSDIPEDEWTALRVPTRSGFYLILVGLVWWRRKLEEAAPASSEQLQSWWDAVEDVEWVTSVWGRSSPSGTSPSGTSPSSTSPSTTIPSTTSSSRKPTDITPSTKRKAPVTSEEPLSKRPRRHPHPTEKVLEHEKNRGTRSQRNTTSKKPASKAAETVRNTRPNGRRNQVRGRR